MSEETPGPEIDQGDVAIVRIAAANTIGRLRAELENQVARGDRLEAKLGQLQELTVEPQPAPELAAARQKLDDALDDFHFERKQVVALRDVLVEVFNCMDTGDPSLVFDEDQIALWRENAGMPATT